MEEEEIAKTITLYKYVQDITEYFAEEAKRWRKIAAEMEQERNKYISEMLAYRDCLENVKSLAENQQDLPPEFAKILNDNWEDLLI